MYFEDKGERQLTLRPELTAPVMRMIAEEMRNDTNHYVCPIMASATAMRNSRKAVIGNFSNTVSS